MNEGTATPTAQAAGSTLLVSGIMFGVSMIVSVVFGYLMFADPTRLADAWTAIRALPLLVQILIWGLFLPWMLALWIWTMPLALGVRMVLAGAILLVAEYLLFPWKK